MIQQVQTPPAVRTLLKNFTSKHAVPVKALEHDGILRAQVICRQRTCLPAQPLVGVGKVLGPGNVCAELQEANTANV